MIIFLILKIKSVSDQGEMYRTLHNGSNVISMFLTNSKLLYDMIDNCVWFILEHFQLFLNESFLMYSFLNWNFLDDFRMIYQS